MRKPSAENLEALNLFDRFEVLSDLGLLAHEEKIGHPERPFEEWTEEEFETVLTLFNSWPMRDASVPEFQDMIKSFGAHFDTDTLNDGDLKQALEHAAEALSIAAKDAFGKDAPFIELAFEFTPEKRGYFGGLRPDGKIQINTAKFNYDRVGGSDYDGAESFVELICHEATHAVQRFCSEQSDLKTEDLYLGIYVSESFYEATEQAKQMGRWDLYLQHPLEVQARDVAKNMIEELRDPRRDLTMTGNAHQEDAPEL